MHYIVDNENKIIFGWSAKAGCSHIKKIYLFLKNGIIHNKNIHDDKKWDTKLPSHIDEYDTLLIIRNPYKRLVSGFLDKYKKNGQFRYMWGEKNITFTDFVNVLCSPDCWEKIEKHHFCHQIGYDFNQVLLNKSKSIHVYDICSIDYEHIEKLYNKSIPEELIHFRGGHERTQTIKMNELVYNLELDLYHDYDVPTKYFFNKALASKVYEFYKPDFLFFESNGFSYTFQ